MAGKKTIVITGASDGVGAAAARRLTADGENVVIVGRSPQKKTKAVAAETGADFFRRRLFPSSTRYADSPTTSRSATSASMSWPTTPAEW